MYQCLSYSGGYPFCKKCLLSTHHSLLLHIIEVSQLYFSQVTEFRVPKQKWDTIRGHFVKVSLQSLGLRYQLGHVPGHYCISPSPCHTNFMVIDGDALHRVSISYCGCPGCPDRYAQLLEIGWWPSTTFEPQTVATFNALR